MSKKRVMGVEAIIKSGGKYPVHKKMSRMVVGAFFNEIKNTILECKEVRLPGKDNGTVSLVIKSRSINSLMCMKRFNSKNIDNILKGAVKPCISGFAPDKAAPNSLIKDFSIQCSYPKDLMKKLSKFDNKKRSLLMEIY